MRIRHSKIAKLVILGTAAEAQAAVDAVPALRRVTIERIVLPPPEPGATQCWVRVASLLATEDAAAFLSRAENALVRGGVRIVRRALGP